MIFSLSFMVLMLGTVVYGLYAVRLLPLVIESRSEPTEKLYENAVAGDIVGLFDEFPLETGEYKVFVVSQRSRHPKVLVADDLPELLAFKDLSKGIVSGGDMATCEDRVIVVHDGTVVKSVDMCIDVIAGFQGQDYGWVEVVDQEGFITWFDSLSPIYWPVLWI